MENLRSKQTRAEEAYASMATKFGEDTKKTPNEEFFKIVRVRSGNKQNGTRTVGNTAIARKNVLHRNVHTRDEFYFLSSVKLLSRKDNYRVYYSVLCVCDGCAKVNTMAESIPIG